MNKNWLIRTTQNKILGPISKDKLIEFIEKGSLTQNDEVTSGNGYWFYLHEQELVDRYIVGSEPQGFNPISEGKTVLCHQRRNQDQFVEEVDTAETNNTMVIGQDLLAQLSTSGQTDEDESEGVFSSAEQSNHDPQMLPNAEDLEFPDMDDDFELPSIEIEESYSVGAAPHQTAIIHPENEDDSDDEVFEGRLPDHEDLEYPDVTPVAATNHLKAEEAPSQVIDMVQSTSSHQEKKLPKVSLPVAPPSRPMRQKSESRVSDAKKVEVLKSSRSDRYLFYVFFIMISLVIYAVYFYYSKISSHRAVDIKEELSAVIFSSAQAQDGLQKKNNLAEVFTFKNGNLSINLGIAGADLAFSTSSAAIDCKNSNEFFSFFQFIRADSSKRDDISKELLRCPQLLSDDGKAMMTVLQLEEAKRLPWIENNRSALSREDRDTIDRIVKFRHSHPLLKEVLVWFNSYIETLHGKSSAAALYRANESVLSFCRTKGANSVLAQLLEVMVALSVDNQAWAKKVFSDLLNKNLLQIAFHIDPSYFSQPADQARYEENMRRAMFYIVERLHDQMLAKLAINYFSVFDQSEPTLALMKKLEAEWSLVEIRRLIGQKINGQFFFIPWFYILQNRAQEQEVGQFVNLHLSAELVGKLGLQLMPIVLKHFPDKQEVRSQLINLLKSSLNSTDLFEQYLLLQALKVPFFYKALSPLPKNYRGANFQLERQLFRKLLEEDGLVYFSLFNLIRLGDTKRSLLWWMIL